MKLIEKIINWKTKINDKIRLSLLKSSLKDRLYIKSDIQIKNSSRINIFGGNGRLSIGDAFSIGYNSEIYVWDGRISIGNNTSINDNCKFYGNILIGSNCFFASNIFASSGTHNFTVQPELPLKVQDKIVPIDKQIVIEDDCWLGWGVVLMPGVYIGKGAIIGSNAVITKDVFPYTVHGGIPGKQISKRLDFTESFTTLNSSDTKCFPFFYRGIDYKQFEFSESFNDGISIIDNTAVFLLTKSENRKFNIEGKINKDTEIEVSLNNKKYNNIKLSEGMFKSNMDLNSAVDNPLEDYDVISNELKQMFDIIIIRIPNGDTSQFNLKITSIGLYEN